MTNAADGAAIEGASSSSAQAEPSFETYGMEDFARIPKFDAHVHINSEDPTLLELARQDGFELMLVNVGDPEFPHIATQRAVAVAFAKMDPARVHWTTTFSMEGFGLPGWADRVKAGLVKAKSEGARAVKIWKNVGTSEVDADGRLIALDHPGLSPVFQHVRALGVVVIGHQGEPHNCWLPLDQMTTDNDRRYFSRRPQSHLYLHPHLPTHEELIETRDRFLVAHPTLPFVGAHLGSLEHCIDRLSAFLDRFPNASVDLAARMSHLQYQSIRDREQMRAFFIRYQDRLLYGTDLTFNEDTDPVRFRRVAHEIWVSDWHYLATTESQHIASLDVDVTGLALPRDVIDKLYYGNAMRVFSADSIAIAH